MSSKRSTKPVRGVRGRVADPAAGLPSKASPKAGAARPVTLVRRTAGETAAYREGYVAAWRVRVDSLRKDLDHARRMVRLASKFAQNARREARRVSARGTGR